MFFITPILAGLIIAGTLGAGAYVTEKAQDAVLQYNLSAISHILEIYNVDHGEYPESLSQLIEDGELKNLDISSYSYQIVSKELVKVCEVEKSTCWSSY